MTYDDMSALLERIFDEIRTVRAAGQKEYAQDETDIFSNFEAAGRDLGIARESVLWIFAMKHRDGIASYLRGHRSQRENVRGRIKDLITYLILLWGMIEENDACSDAPTALTPSTSDGSTTAPDTDWHSAYQQQIAALQDAEKRPYFNSSMQESSRSSSASVAAPSPGPISTALSLPEEEELDLSVVAHTEPWEHSETDSSPT